MFTIRKQYFCMLFTSFSLDCLQGFAFPVLTRFHFLVLILFVDFLLHFFSADYIAARLFRVHHAFHVILYCIACVFTLVF